MARRKAFVRKIWLNNIASSAKKKSKDAIDSKMQINKAYVIKSCLAIVLLICVVVWQINRTS